MYSHLSNWSLAQFVSAIGSQFPLLHQFAQTEQDERWHGEGNVYVHTELVLNAAQHLIQTDARHLSGEQQTILLLAAVLHDYAKPLVSTVRSINGETRVVSPKHEELGASLLMFIDPPLGLSQPHWRQVVQLVGYHHLPKLLVVENKPRPDYLKLFRRVEQVELLYWLEVADMQGRTCTDKAEQLELLEMFKLEAQAQGIWNQDPYYQLEQQVSKAFPELAQSDIRRIAEQIKSRLEDGQIQIPEQEICRAYQYKTQQSHLVLMCGLPGAGKSHYINQHYSDYAIVSMDEIRQQHVGDRQNQNHNDAVARIAHQQLRQHLRAKSNVVWDATNTRSDFRNRIAQIGFNYGAFVETLLIQGPISHFIEADKQRKFTVGANVIRQMQQSFQLPDIDETHTLSFIDGVV